MENGTSLKVTFSTLSSTWCAGEMGYKEFDLLRKHFI